MKTSCLVFAAWLAAAGAAAAQEPAEIPRADAHFVLGWQNLHKDQRQDNYNDWLNDIFFGGAGIGWHWNAHLKTQIDFGSGTHGEQSRFETLVINGAFTGQSSRVRVRQDSLSIAQQYQFFRNQWFHPRVGAGLELARETTREEYQPVTMFDNAARVSRVIIPARTEGPEHRFIARPFVESGFKAYMTRRAFFTTDARLMFRSGVDEVLFRLGFGFDF